LTTLKIVFRDDGEQLGASPMLVRDVLPPSLLQKSEYVSVKGGPQNAVIETDAYKDISLNFLEGTRKKH
jgi:hypothetical protein